MKLPALFTFLITVGLSFAQQTPGRPAGTAGFYAVVVGVSEYPEVSGLAKLQFAAKDARDISSALMNAGYKVRTLLNENATRSFILKTLGDLASAGLTKEDQVLFYFSGHGFNKDGRNVLATYGVTTTDMATQGLSVEEVLTELDRMSIGNRGAIIDACRSKPIQGEKSGVTPTFQALPKTENTAVLFSTTPGEASFEDEKAQQGLFTRHLLEGLNGAAAGTSGQLTFDSLAGYVEKAVRGEAFSSGRRQSPSYVPPATKDTFVVVPLQTAHRNQTDANRANSSPAVTGYSATRRSSFGGGAFETRYDPTRWSTVGTPDSERLEFALASSRINAVLSHESVQSSFEKLADSAVQTLGGPAAVTAVEKERVVRRSAPFYKFVLTKGSYRYLYYFYTGSAGTLQAVVYGPNDDAAWATGIPEQLLKDTDLVRN